MPAGVAATLGANYATARCALHTRAAVRADEVVVVTGGAGGVGSAAIQPLAPSGPASSPPSWAKAARPCVEFGAHMGIDSSAQDLVAAVNAFSDGRGADVVIDTVGGSVHRLPPNDRLRGIVVVGFTSGHIPS